MFVSLWVRPRLARCLSWSGTNRNFVGILLPTRGEWQEAARGGSWKKALVCGIPTTGSSFERHWGLGRARLRLWVPGQSLLGSELGESTHPGDKQEEMMNCEEDFQTTASGIRTEEKGRRTEAQRISLIWGLCVSGTRCHPEAGRLGAPCGDTTLPTCSWSPGAGSGRDRPLSRPNGSSGLASGPHRNSPSPVLCAEDLNHKLSRCSYLKLPRLLSACVLFFSSLLETRASGI